MEKLAMCRVCLGEDIRLVPIVGTYLQEIYESLVFMSFETEDSRPILVCYICRARLKNCYELRKSCLQSEELLTQMLNCNEFRHVQLQAKNNKKRLTMHNVIHFSVEQVLGMDADNVGVEALKCKVKDEPIDDEDVSEDVLEENSVSDDIQSADLREKSMSHVMEMETDSVGVETLVVLCDVKVEQSDPEGASTPKGPLQTVPRRSEDSTSNNLNEHELGQDTFKKRNEVTTADITDDTKEVTAIVQYMCATCQQFYSSKCELQGHVRLCSDMWKKDLSRMNITNAHTHTTQKPHQFNEYNKCLLLLPHSSEKPHQTDICNKQFILKGSFTKHMQTNVGKKLYHCEVCKKQFSHKSHFTAHMRIHTGEKLYHCDICKKQFSHKNNFKTHMRTHTGEKPFHCDVCKKQFSQKSHFTKHMRTHTGEKPYHCNLCTNQFSQRSHFTSHMRTHTGEKPYHCDICKKEFSKKENLTRHTRTHNRE